MTKVLIDRLFKELMCLAKLQWSVLVKCSNCGKEFRAMTVQIGSKQAMRSKDYSEKCPHCGAANTFGTQDLLWKDS